MTDPQKPSEKPSDKKVAAVITATTVLAVAQIYLEKAFGLAERAVVALERTAEATENLASAVDKDGVRIHGHVTTRPGV